MDIPNRITQRRITRIDIPSRISQTDIPIHGRTQRIDITRMAITLVSATIESEWESIRGNMISLPINFQSTY